MELRKGGVMRVEGGRGARVEVESGEVWLTQHRDPADYFIRAGESFIVAAGNAVISAFKDSRLKVLAG